MQYQIHKEEEKIENSLKGCISFKRKKSIKRITKPELRLIEIGMTLPQTRIRALV